MKQVDIDIESDATSYKWQVRGVPEHDPVRITAEHAAYLGILNALDHAANAHSHKQVTLHCPKEVAEQITTHRRVRPQLRGLHETVIDLCDFFDTKPVFVPAKEKTTKRTSRREKTSDSRPQAP